MDMGMGMDMYVDGPRAAMFGVVSGAAPVEHESFPQTARRHPPQTTGSPRTTSSSTSTPIPPLLHHQTPLEPATTKSKASQSCDGCRHRKIRCVWTTPLPDIPDASSVDIQQVMQSAGVKCVRCTGMAMPCMFKYEVKKRGPPKGFVRKTKSSPKSNGESSPGDQRHPRLDSYPPIARSDTSSNKIPLPALASISPPIPSSAFLTDTLAPFRLGGGENALPMDLWEQGLGMSGNGSERYGLHREGTPTGGSAHPPWLGLPPLSGYAKGAEADFPSREFSGQGTSSISSLGQRTSTWRDGVVKLAPDQAFMPRGLEDDILDASRRQQSSPGPSTFSAGKDRGPSAYHPGLSSNGAAGFAPDVPGRPIGIHGSSSAFDTFGGTPYLPVLPSQMDLQGPSSPIFPSSARHRPDETQTPDRLIRPAQMDSSKIGHRSVVLTGSFVPARPGYGSQHQQQLAASTRDDSFVRLRLEDLMTRADAERICEMYIDFIWHLIPCLHIPSFRADFAVMRDRHDPAFLALALSVIGLTFVLVPRQWLPESILRREDFRRTVTLVVQASEQILDQVCDTAPAILTLTCHYLNVQSNHQLGRRNNLYKSLGQCFLYVAAMRLFEPGSYIGLDPVEREMRKRLYWLSFGMDKTKACLADEPMMIRTNEYGSIDLPESVDDAGVYESPVATRTAQAAPPITGFIHISRLFSIQEQVLALYRQQRHCLSKSDIDGTLRQLSILLERCQVEMVGCVVELKLAPNEDAQQNVPGFDAIHGFFQSPSSSIRGRSFLVAQANIYVTQQWIRYLILQCRLSLVQQTNVVCELDPIYPNESLEVICQDLLHVLCSIPIECIASNGLPLIEKVRYIAAGLLNVDTGHASLEVSSENQSILMDFLVLMSEIERNYAI